MSGNLVETNDKRRNDFIKECEKEREAQQEYNFKKGIIQLYFPRSDFTFAYDKIEDRLLIGDDLFPSCSGIGMVKHILEWAKEVVEYDYLKRARKDKELDRLKKEKSE